MEHVRRIRVLAPIAVIAVAGTVGIARPAALRAADPPWDPPPCPPGQAATSSGAGAWYSLDPDLDADGWLVGWRLSLGRLDDGVVRGMDLPPESFASGPVGGIVLVGDDDGARSRLRIVDVAAGCATEIGRQASVVRSAVLSADGRTAWEHRVNRATRADEGVWRRPLGGGATVRVMSGLAPDARFGPTFSTDLVVADDGRVAVASCGELRCRVRVYDPGTGRVDRVDDTGALLGISGGRAIAYAPCHGFPCRVEAIDLRSGRRTTLLAGAGPAALGGEGDRILVHETPDGTTRALDVDTLRYAMPDGSVPGAPVRGGSTATSGADAPGGSVVLAPSGHLTNPATAHRLDVATGAVVRLGEVEP